MIGDKLHIVVCVKQTPSAATPVPGAAVPMAMNPFDEYALEEGVRLKEKAGGKAVVTAVSLGAAGAAETLRDAIARGADDCVLLSSPDLEGSDSAATAYALSLAVQKLAKERGPVDLVLFGKQTNDSDTGQVGPQTAAALGVPGVAFVKKMELAGGKATVDRMMEDGADTLEMDLPAVACVVKEINEPRIASLKGKMASKKAVIPTWGPAELGADKARVGKAASSLSIGKPYSPPKRGGGIKIEGATAQEKAKNLLAKLKERKLI
jgi:electron transfer flavoprotein alpha/beta subunit